MKAKTPRKRTFKVWVHIETGQVVFNWQTTCSAAVWRSHGFERATLTLTPPKKKRSPR